VNVIGEKLTILTSPDPTITGVSGRVLMETLNTLVLESTGRTLRVEKKGSAFMLLSSGKVLTGLDLAGRLQDRLGRRAP
jgi:RNase P/RNase MRP subunit p29